MRGPFGVASVSLLLGAGAASAQVPEPSRTWAVGLRLQEGWDSNPRFVSAPADMLVERLAATVSHLRRGPRWDLAVSGQGSAALYRSDSDLNQVAYTGAAAGSVQVSPRLTGHLSGGLSSAYAHDSAALTSQALLLPLVLTRTVSAGGGLRYRSSPRIRFVADARYERVTFNADGGSAMRLPGGAVLGGTVAVSPRVTTRDTLTVAYDRQQSDAAVRDGHSQSLTVGWARTVGTRLTVSAAGGPMQFTLAGRPGSGWTVRANAGLNARVRRSTLDLRYARGVDQAFGFGRDRLSDVLHASYGATAGRRVRLAASGTYGYTRDPKDAAFRFWSGLYGAEVAFALSRRLDLSASCTRRVTSPDHGPSVTGQSAGVALTFGREWKR